MWLMCGWRCPHAPFHAYVFDLSTYFRKKDSIPRFDDGLELIKWKRKIDLMHLIRVHSVGLLLLRLLVARGQSRQTIGSRILITRIRSANEFIRVRVDVISKIPFVP